MCSLLLQANPYLDDFLKAHKHVITSNSSIQKDECTLGRCVCSIQLSQGWSNALVSPRQVDGGEGPLYSTSNITIGNSKGENIIVF